MCFIVTPAFAAQPIFTYQKCNEIDKVLEGVADVCLDVDFKDGGKHDFAALNYEGDMADQTLSGLLVNDLGSVFVTGRWAGPFTDKSAYQITLFTSRLPGANRFYHNVDGSTTAVSFNTTFEIDSLTTEEQFKQTNSSTKPVEAFNVKNAFPISGMSLNVVAFFDNSVNHWLKSKQLNPYKIIRRVFHEANSYFKDPTLTTTVKLNLMNITFVKQFGQELQADTQTVRYLQNQTSYFDKKYDSHIFFCFPQLKGDVNGKGELESVCSDDITKKIVIVEFQEDLAVTSHIVAHELGHNIGMKHDFFNAGDFKINRWSHNGHRCSEVGGVMDYNRLDKLVWSMCSVQDFAVYYNMIVGRDLKFCLQQLPIFHKSVCEYVGRKAEIPCSTGCKHVLAVDWYYVQNDTSHKILTDLRLFGEPRFNSNQSRFKQDDIDVIYTPSVSKLVIKKIKNTDAGTYRCELKLTKHTSNCSPIQETILSADKGNAMINMISYLLEMMHDIAILAFQLF